MNSNSFTKQNFRKPKKVFIEEYSKIRPIVLAEMNSYMLAYENIEQIVGEGNIGMMLDNHKNHAEFIEAFLLEFNKEVLPEIMIWVFKAYMSRGFKTEYWDVQLNGWLAVLKSNMSKEGFESIEPIYKWMLDNIYTVENLINIDSEN